MNRTVTDWNQLTVGGIGALTGNTYSFRKRVRKVITSEAKLKGSEVKGREVLIRKF